jgi:hypothetical protein
MSIVKNCAERYHIARTKSLQIGTVHHYASLDDKFIGDPDEGASILEIQPTHRPVELSEAQLGRVLSPNIQVRGGGLTLMPGSISRTSYSVPNAFIFSTSEVDSPSLPLARSMGYDSYYEIVNPAAFAESVALGIAETLIDSGQMRSFGRFRIWKCHSRVKYSQQKAQQYADFSEWDVIIDAIFSKRETSSLDPTVRFADNCEYRFAWLPIADDDRTLFVPAATPLLVDVSTEIRGCCR